MSPTRSKLLRTALCSAVAAAASLVAPALARAQPAHRLRDRVGPYEVQLLAGGVPVPAFSHYGETWVLGRLGDRYTIRVENRSDRRVEAVVSVDGRDVIDGRPGDFRRKRGYLVPARGRVDIDGWRLSQAEVAAFRFSSVPDAYAARVGSGREVGVVGVAIFPERYVPPPPPVYAPYDPARYFDGESGGGAAGPRARSEAAPPAAPAGAAPRAQASNDSRPAEKAAPAESFRPGLGTAFGERVGSPVEEVSFERADPAHPSALIGVRYNDRRGLLALGIPVDEWPSIDEQSLRRTAEPFPVVDRGYAAPPPGWSR